MNNETYTEDLSKFGSREFAELERLLKAMRIHGLPEDFDDADVRAGFNLNSGYVFLTNSEFQVAMESEGKLYSFYSTPYEGVEGSLDDLISQYENLHPEDQEYVDNLRTEPK